LSKRKEVKMLFNKQLKKESLKSVVEKGVYFLERLETFQKDITFIDIRKKNESAVILRIQINKNSKIHEIPIIFFNLYGKEKINFVGRTRAIKKNKNEYMIDYIRINFHLIKKNAKEPFMKAVNNFCHEMIHVYQFLVIGSISGTGHDIYFKKIMDEFNNSLPNTVKTVSDYKETFFINPSKIKNPSTDNLKKAKKLYQDFNRYDPKKIVKLDIPIFKNTVLVKLGEIDNLEYISDKMIFKQDQKTRKRKIRTYIHNFPEHDKKPLLLTNEAGNILIIYDPENQIEVKAEGII